MKLRQAYRAARQLGAGTAVRRIYHAARLRSGLLERIDRSGPFGPDELNGHLTAGQTPSGMLQRRRDGAIPFFFSAAELPSLYEAVRSVRAPGMDEDLHRQVENLARGRLRFFSRWEADLSDPIQWRLNPVNGSTWPATGHWSRLSLFQPELGDVKLVWEASRFAQCYTLVRAQACAADNRAIALALRRIEEWIDANPPVDGPLWACGQEASLRIMAWCFALWAALGTDVLSEGLFAKITASIYRHGRRIAAHIGFARSIRNNHSLSEAVGLYTIGLLFPEFDMARCWRQLGRRILIEDAKRLFFADGSFIQHSMNYHRLALHDCIWAARLGELHGEPFPGDFLAIIAKATAFLFQMHDEPSGRVPNYGSNDGARILPLTGCDYLDYRPVLQSSHYLCHRERIEPSGPWDEALLWLFGRESLQCPVRQRPLASSSFDAGGYYTLRGRESWAMVRCHSYFERPGEADMLHFDLWWRGENILRDAGSYSYFCQPPWDVSFKTTAAHNAVEVDGLDQMTKGPRFLWYDWTKSRVNGRGEENGTEWWEGEHCGYAQRLGVIHRRHVERHADKRWVVIDTLTGEGTHSARLFWRLGDWAHEWNAQSMQALVCSPAGAFSIGVTVEGASSVRAQLVRGSVEADRALGWESLYYGEKQPVPVMIVEARGACPLIFRTTIELSAAG